MEKATDALVDIEFGLAGLTAPSLNRLTSDIRELRRDAGDFED